MGVRFPSKARKKKEPHSGSNYRADRNHGSLDELDHQNGAPGDGEPGVLARQLCCIGRRWRAGRPRPAAMLHGSAKEQEKTVAQKAHLLIVDDEANTLASLSRAFRLEGHEAALCDNANKALDLARSQPFDLILSDVVMPGKDGLTLLEELKALGVTTPVVMMSGQANIEMAVKATRLGALDFLEKPITTDKLLLTVENALKLSRLEDENRELRHRLGKHELVGSGPAMQKLLAQIDRVAASETRVCILGETGTGKELVARAIHEKSPRHENAFITLNCAAVPAELIESELFGHEKGAFTGAAA